MFGASAGWNSTYATGTAASGKCDDSVDPGYAVAVDTTFWNILADADPNSSRVESALRFALRIPGRMSNHHPNSEGFWVTDIDRVYAGPGARKPKLSGVRFSTAGHGAQWENTAGAVMALAHLQSKRGAKRDPGLAPFAEAARNSIKTLLNMYDGIPSTVVGGNYGAWLAWSQGQPLDPRWAGGSDTGLGWPYLRYLATAPTAWAGLMLLYQADAAQPVDENANPYAVPARAVPRLPQDDSCLPSGAMRAP